MLTGNIYWGDEENGLDYGADGIGFFDPKREVIKCLAGGMASWYYHKSESDK